MARILKDIALTLEESLEEKLHLLAPNFNQYRVLRKSVDARKKQVKFIYSVEVAEGNETLIDEPIVLPKTKASLGYKPVVIGAGPAGLFAALRFVERGVPCVLLERGSPAEERIKGINRFWRYGELNLKNNVCYGEGGAGLYSDGKLITRIKSPHIPYILKRLVQFGAPAEIEYLANPHVGSDKIRRLIPKIREYLKSNGCEIYFDSQVTGFEFANHKLMGVKVGDKIIKTRSAILATGHSASDMFEVLHQEGVHLDGKSFAMGLRIEHPQELINRCQYGDYFDHPSLGAANYRLADHDHKTGVGVYSFCMCPGGFVLSSGTEVDGLVCNGMSNFNRGSKFANAAVVVSIDHQKLFGSDLWGGMKLRRELEFAAFDQVQKVGGNKQLPLQRVTDFFEGKTSPVEHLSSPSGGVPVRLDQVLPEFMVKSLKKSLLKFDQAMPGFAGSSGHLYGIESRTSCPIRVTRDPDSLESISHQGLYPCGEGAGYAGGITSAACDGVKLADKIIEISE